MKNMNSKFKPILLVLLSFSTSIWSAQAFSQDMVLGNGQTGTVSCQPGTSPMILDRNPKQVTVGCYRACVYTMLQKSDYYGNAAYCLQTYYPSGTTADNCGSQLTSDWNKAINLANTQINWDLTQGNCEKTIKINF